MHQQSCECLARYAAPFVVEKLDLQPHSPLLLLGWAGDFYRDLLCRRWPDLAVTAGDLSKTNGDGRGAYGAVLLSGLLEGCGRGEYRATVEHATHLLRPGGLLILHDSFLCADATPPPELLLSALGRHVMRGGSRVWSLARLESELGSFGWRVCSTDAIPGDTHLITARQM